MHNGAVVRVQDCSQVPAKHQAVDVWLHMSLSTESQGQASTASSLTSTVVVVAASTHRKTVFIVTTHLGMPFCITSLKKPETSMLPKGDEGESAEQTLEPEDSAPGVHDPWLRSAA